MLYPRYNTHLCLALSPQYHIILHRLCCRASFHCVGGGVTNFRSHCCRRPICLDLTLCLRALLLKFVGKLIYAQLSCRGCPGWGLSASHPMSARYPASARVPEPLFHWYKGVSSVLLAFSRCPAELKTLKKKKSISPLHSAIW